MPLSCSFSLPLVRTKRMLIEIDETNGLALEKSLLWFRREHLRRKRVALEEIGVYIRDANYVGNEKVISGCNGRVAVVLLFVQGSLSSTWFDELL
jgi:hypothetical protein